MPEATRKLADALPADALKDAGQRLLGLLVQRAADAATERVTSLTDRLNDVSDNGGQGLRAALGGRSQDEDDEDDDRAEGDEGDEGDEDGDGDGGGGGLLSRLKEKVKGVFGGGGDGDGPGGGRGSSGKRLKVTNIVEHLDIGLPLRTTYDLWTRFGDFPTFMKKVETVDTMSDEKTQWQAKIFISRRQWEATILEQVPDSHIVWRSKGAKGHVDGAVSFTPLEPNATRVLLVLEYWPKGLFEYTGNLWRAQGRRARLEFKHFRRHAMTTVLLHPEEVEGWRGEIHDGEVVKTHEEALEEEQRAREEEEGSFDETEDESRDETDETPEGEDLEDVDDEYDLEDTSEDEADEDFPEDETDEAETDEDETDEDETEPADEADEDAGADDEIADEDEPADEDEAPAPARRGRRREPAGAGGRRGR